MLQLISPNKRAREREREREYIILGVHHPDTHAKTVSPGEDAARAYLNEALFTEYSHTERTPDRSALKQFKCTVTFSDFKVCVCCTRCAPIASR